MRFSFRLASPLFLCLLAITAGCAQPRTTCTINSDCPASSYCTPGGGCRTDCRNNFDCATGYCITQIGKCSAIPDGGIPNNPNPDLARPPVMDPPDLAMPVEEMPDLAMMPKPEGRYGDVCTMAPLSNECSSGHCSSNPFATGDKECTGPCNSNADCMLGDICIAGLGECAQADIGRACAGANDCRGGACLLGQGGAPSVCTVKCTNAAECPAGWSCSPVSNQFVCIPLDEQPPCASSNQCWFGAQCDAPRQRCLGLCRNSGDCPLFHNCNNNLCVPNQAAGRGGIGDGCNGGNDCRGGACLQNVCVGACGATKATGQWCPAGWGCNPIDAGNGTFALVCLPNGGGAPGAGCNDNGDCASGLCIDMPGYCTRFCNSAPCPQTAPKCVSIGVKVNGIQLMACSK